jgi:hypothetical protein
MVIRKEIQENREVQDNEVGWDGKVLNSGLLKDTMGKTLS